MCILSLRLILTDRGLQTETERPNTRLPTIPECGDHTDDSTVAVQPRTVGGDSKHTTKLAVALFTNICFPGNTAYLLLRVRGCVLDVLTPRAAVVVFRRKTVGDVGGHVTKPSTTIGHENWSVLWSMCTDRVSQVKNAVRRWEHNATLLATGKYKTSWKADRINNNNYGISETQWSLYR